MKKAGYRQICHTLLMYYGVWLLFILVHVYTQKSRAYSTQRLAHSFIFLFCSVFRILCQDALSLTNSSIIKHIKLKLKKK